MVFVLTIKEYLRQDLTKLTIPVDIQLFFLNNFTLDSYKPLIEL